MIKLDESTLLTTDVMLKLIKQHLSTEAPRLTKLYDYYKAKNAINRRTMKDSTKPNNKIANPYARYITDTLVGYFVGKPITYNSADTKIMEELSMIFEYNDEADENSELAKSASMYGVAYERLYVDEDGMIRFKKLDSRQCFPIFDRSIDSNLLYFIRYFEDYDIVTETTYYVIELLTRNSVITYRANETLSTITAVDEVPHYFKMVPIAIYENNEEEIGDYEEVISLIDAYDKMESDTLNDFEYFVDAYLALYGFTADPEDVQAMKENRVLLMDEGTSAEWLTKDTSDTHIENQKIRLDKDIHKYSFCPDMSDQEFAGNASGVAIKYKLLGTEDLVSIKERKFKKGLQQRLELISMIDSLFGTDFDWRDIDIIFTRNIPSNDTDIATVVSALKDTVSDETLLAQVPFVDNVQDEMERLKKQKEENPFYSTSLVYRTQAMERDNNA